MNWGYLVSKYGKQRSAQIFEDIALAYVQDVYPQYTWYPTKKTRDGNKDAQRKEVYWGEDDSFDVWEEAKFKRGKALRRQDIDPTILSGLIQGNVRLIIFVTNASLPDKLLERAVLGARIRGIKVSCVLSDQLDSWITQHPDVYQRYWGDSLGEEMNSGNTIWLHSASFSDLVSTDFQAFGTRKLMMVNSIYLLTFSISSNIKTEARLILTDDFPFEPVFHPSYDDPANLPVDTGLSTFALLLKAVRPFSGGVNLCFEINNTAYSRVTSEIEIVPGSPYSIVYSQQLQVISTITGHIHASTDGLCGNIISIYAESGMGKSFILKNLHKEFGLKRDMTIVNFESDPSSLMNYLLICRIILFFLLGNFFWTRNTWSREELEGQKILAIRMNARNMFDDASLSKIFDGCFDAGVAKDIIEKLSRKRQNGCSLIREKAALTDKLLLVDDFQYLNPMQFDILFRILHSLSSNQSDCIVVIAATKGRFSSQKFENRFLSLTPNIFELTGLTPEDMAETLGSCFCLKPRSLLNLAPKILSPNPLLTCELLRILYTELGGQAGDMFNMIREYSLRKNRTVILKNRFTGLEKQYYLLDVIFRFKKGISASILKKSKVLSTFSVSEDLKLLSSRGMIFIQDGLVLPYHDYYIISYRQLRKKKYYNRLTGSFLRELFEVPVQLQRLDSDQLLAMLIACGKQYQRLYEKKVKEKIIHYMESTQFGAALHYCTYYYELIKAKEPRSLTSEEYVFLFYYAYCLVHCGDHEIANRLLLTIYNHAGNDIPEKYAAGAEILSQRFWELKLEGMIENSYFIQNGVEYIISLPSIKGQDFARLEHAYDTCFNRRMVIFLLQDCCSQARKVYAERLMQLSKKYTGNEFRSRAATLIMDYARGTIYFQPKSAEHLLNIALQYFSCQQDIHYRRMLLCHIDRLLAESVNGNMYSHWKMDPFIVKLLQGGFYSEYFKAVLKRCACQLVSISQKEKDIRNSKITGLPDGAAFIETAQAELSSALLETGLQPSERCLFLLNVLRAYFSVCTGNFENSVSYLVDTEIYVREAGESYHRIIRHNMQHISEVMHIAWATENIALAPNTYYLDSRFW